MQQLLRLLAVGSNPAYNKSNTIPKHTSFTLTCPFFRHSALWIHTTCWRKRDKWKWRFLTLLLTLFKWVEMLVLRYPPSSVPWVIPEPRSSRKVTTCSRSISSIRLPLHSRPKRPRIVLYVYLMWQDMRFLKELSSVRTIHDPIHAQSLRYRSARHDGACGRNESRSQEISFIRHLQEFWW